MAVWTTTASKALLEILIDNQEEFHKPTRRPRFWADVSKLMVEKRFLYSGEQCKSRVEVLKSVYKDYVDDHSQTGAQGPFFEMNHEPTRELMMMVGELLKGSVTVNPKLTVAAGVRSLLKRPEEVNIHVPSINLQAGIHGLVTIALIVIQEPSTSTADQTGRVGRSRPPELKRKQSLKERQVIALEQKDSALAAIAQRFTSSNSE